MTFEYLEGEACWECGDADIFLALLGEGVGYAVKEQTAEDNWLPV